jgi:hypothetical protein
MRRSQMNGKWASDELRPEILQRPLPRLPSTITSAQALHEDFIQYPQIYAYRFTGAAWTREKVIDWMTAHKLTIDAFLEERASSLACVLPITRGVVTIAAYSVGPGAEALLGII